MCPCETEGEIENNFVLFIWWFHRRWWGLSSPSAAVCTRTHTHTHTHTHTLIFCPLSIHLRPSSLQSICHPGLLSLMTVLALFHHFCLSGMSFFISGGFIWFMGTQLLVFLFLLRHSISSALCLCSASSSSSRHYSHHYLSRQNLPTSQMCRGKKNRIGQSVNSWHLGLALSARTKWTAVSLVWSVLFMPFKVTTSTRPLWRKEYTNTGWHRAEPHYYIWVISSLQSLLVQTHTCSQCVCIKLLQGHSVN